MRKLIAKVFNYSLCALLTDEGTEFWKFCLDAPENREPDDPAQLAFLQSAYAQIIGHSASPLLGGVSFWRSLMRLDLIDELQVSMFPYVAGEGTRLFDGVPNSYRLDLVPGTTSSNGIDELQYRRHR